MCSTGEIVCWSVQRTSHRVQIVGVGVRDQEGSATQLGSNRQKRLSVRGRRSVLTGRRMRGMMLCERFSMLRNTRAEVAVCAQAPARPSGGGLAEDEAQADQRHRQDAVLVRRFNLEADKAAVGLAA